MTLFLLRNNIVARGILGEADPLVAAFWRAVKNQPEALIKRLEDTEPTLENWKEVRASEPTKLLDKAFTCIFLNRTSYGGIIAERTGPIGGMKQESKYTVDCRYALETTAQRIRECHKLLARVDLIHEGSYESTIRAAQILKPHVTKIYYLDPPFFHKADRLYRKWFAKDQHDALRNFLLGFGKPWILSYDDAAEVRKLYAEAGFLRHRAKIHYTSPSHGTRRHVDELVITNLPQLPTDARFVPRRDDRLAKAGDSHSNASRK